MSLGALVSLVFTGVECEIGVSNNGNNGGEETLSNVAVPVAIVCDNSGEISLDIHGRLVIRLSCPSSGNSCRLFSPPLS